MVATRRSRRPHLALAAGAAAALVLLSGCSSGDDGSGAGSSSDASVGTTGEVVARSQLRSAADPVGTAAPSAAPGSTSRGSAPGGAQVEQQKVISTGNIQLRSDDVGQAIFDVHKVADEYAGTIAQDDTETDDDGAPLRSRMVLRVPTSDFDHAMTDLEKVATLISSKRQSEDVTTQVLDLGARVDAQRRSIDRIQVLFDHATSIRDIVNIESELSRRQADLESLEAQQRYLADQTSLSTITLSVERTPAKVPTPPSHHDEAGFISGLSGGWGALKSFLVGASTVAGALLPWLVLALLLAVPGWPLVRRVRRRAASAPTA